MPSEDAAGWAGYVARLRLNAARRKSVVGAVSRSQEGGGLKKVLGAVDLVMLGIGGIIGAGVFVLTGVAARNFAGPAVILSYMLAAFASLMAALCYTEFAVALPVAGSAYNYIAVTYGELPAFLCGCDLVLEYTISAAAVARGWTSYAATLVGQPSEAFRYEVTPSIRLDFLAVAIIALQTAILCRGIKESSQFNMVVNIINLACIAFVLLAGVGKVRRENYSPFSPFGTAGIFSGASIVFFSFIGFDTVATAAEEVRNPGRDLPLGIIGSLVICTALYAGMCAVITGMVPYNQIDLDAPFAVAFREAGMGWAETIVSAGALTGITTSLLVSMLGQPRIYMTMSRDGLLPPWFGQLHPAYGTPVHASLVTGCSAAAMAFAVDIDALAQLVSIGTLCVFTFVCSATLARRYLPPDAPAAGQPPLPAGEEAAVRRAVLRRVVALVSLALCCSFSIELGGGSRFVRRRLTPLLALAFLRVAASFLQLEQRCLPAAFSVPLMPWTPALGVYACCQLIASLGPIAWLRFFVYYSLCAGVYCYYRGGVDPEAADAHSQRLTDGPAEAEGDGEAGTTRGLELVALARAGQGPEAGGTPGKAEDNRARLLPNKSAI